MRVVLVGADFEENLGIAMVGAALRDQGHRVTVVGLSDRNDVESTAKVIVARRPHLVGMGIQFQHWSTRFFELARELRCVGYQGHITCGGQYPTMACEDVLRGEPAIDSVVLHEGESTIVELARALAANASLRGTAGLALRDETGSPVRTAARPLCQELDSLSWPMRYRDSKRHLGLPFIPICGSRGCWGSCSFCAITAAHRSAREQDGSRALRLRSVENLAAEMAHLWHDRGGPCLFCFHDETLLLPRPEDSLRRLRALRSVLDELEVGELGIIGKCRPDCVTPQLAKELRQLGVFRMFVGIENGSQVGLDHLNRHTKVNELHEALEAFQDADIYVCYNLLLFEPEARLKDVRENIAFIRQHPFVAMNFCRAEAYHGTPLHLRLAREGALLGDYRGWDYRIFDDRTELAFRAAASIFRHRNYDAEGVANRYIGMGYLVQVLRTFFDGRGTQAQALFEQARRLIGEISLDTASMLERVVDLAEHAELSDHDGFTRQVAVLGLELAARDRDFQAEIDAVITETHAIAAMQSQSPMRTMVSARARALMQQLAVAGCFATALAACGGETGSSNDEDAGASGDPSSDVLRGDGGTTGPGLGGTVSRGGTTSQGGRGAGGASGFGGDMAPGGAYTSYGGFSSGGVMVDGGSPPIGGRTFGGMNGDGGGPPSGGRTFGGMNGDGGGPPAMGGWVSDPAGAPSTLGGWTQGGALGDGGSPPAGGRTFGGMNGDGGGPPSGGRTFGGMNGDGGGPPATGGWVTDPGGAPPSLGGSVSGGTAGSGGSPPAGGRTFGGMNGDGGGPPSGGVSVVDPPPSPLGHQPPAPTSTTVEHFRDSRPTGVVRSRDLALFCPPSAALEAVRTDDGLAVVLTVGEPAVSTRWQCDGEVLVSGDRALWRPSSDDDQLAVAVRGQGGVSFATLRARDVMR